MAVSVCPNGLKDYANYAKQIQLHFIIALVNILSEYDINEATTLWSDFGYMMFL